MRSVGVLLAAKNGAFTTRKSATEAPTPSVVTMITGGVGKTNWTATATPPTRSDSSSTRRQPRRAASGLAGRMPSPPPMVPMTITTPMKSGP